MTRLSFFLLALTFSANLLAQTNFYTYSNQHTFAPSDPCRVFIGVGTSRTEGGLKVDYTVDNTPATASGIKAGDVIMAIDGIQVRSQGELERERDKHQQGEAFTLTILRNGQQQTINARFKECTEEEREAAMERMEKRMAEKTVLMEDLQKRMEESFKNMSWTERPILGVYENTEANTGNGLVIESLVPGKGAEKAGLQSGDVIVKVEGKPVSGSNALRDALNNHKAGEEVKVTLIRDGNTLTKTVPLSSQNSFSFKEERDPCKVFIGVYTSAHSTDGRGLLVNGVIANTPAKESNVQPGDLILAFNGKAVNSYQELTSERDRQKPGDAFTLAILRNGAKMDIKARFKSCDSQAAQEETVEVLEQSADRKEPQIMEPGQIALEAFPNPTYGTVNIRFEAEAAPTTVRIYDLEGKMVYTKELPQFSGSFAEQVNLFGNKAGNYVVSVQQGDVVRTRQITLLPRA
ncbi:MAG: PDZ domain-containing protein [Saprospiraceae bacterium]|nr:PDZ domain-containing protein [Saprospiraceae bacterium]